MSYFVGSGAASCRRHVLLLDYIKIHVFQNTPVINLIVICQMHKAFFVMKMSQRGLSAALCSRLCPGGSSKKLFINNLDQSIFTFALLI